MSQLRIDRLRLENFRCFAAIEVTFEPDQTVLFAENGGGKTALLTGLAMGLAILQRGSPRALQLDIDRDVRKLPGPGEHRESAERCSLTWTAHMGEQPDVTWSIIAKGASMRKKYERREASSAMESARPRGKYWPLMGYYGTGRFATDAKSRRRKAGQFQDRWDGYAECLDPASKDGPLLEWLRAEALGDLVRPRRGEPERGLAQAVMNAMRQATPGVQDIWYDPAEDSPMVVFKSGQRAHWAELSDGFHVFMALVGDIARRAAILNSHGGARAPAMTDGVVLIDEIDLHLHPRWQRVVLDGLRSAFPRLQFIISTHSPQVLGSALNRQARMLENFQVRTEHIFIEGRDSNAILRDLMGDDRGNMGKEKLDLLYDAIDGERLDEARRLIDDLRIRWGGNDPELIRAEGMLDWEV